MMRVFFTSDLHLSDLSAVKNQNFIQFIKNEIQPGDVLVLGGDIFDLFIGRGGFFQKKNAVILGAIKAALARGVSIRFVEGNHDFLLSKIFLGSMGDWEVWPESGWINSPMGKIYVEHGDLINKKDYGYRLLRLITRSLIGRLLIRSLPDFALAKIGDWSSRQSRKYNNLERLPESGREHTQKLFTKHATSWAARGAKYVFFGHSHLSQFEVLTHGSGWYVNVGFHETKIPYALIETSGGEPIIKYWG